LAENPYYLAVLEGDESTFQQQKHGSNKITKPTEEEYDQSDLRLANYAQNSHQTLGEKLSGGHVRCWTGYVRSLLNISRKVGTCPVQLETFFSTLILEIRGTKLDET
jgi:hypothetical protein